MPPSARYQLFLDGVCHLCSREARYLNSKDREGKIEFIDISAPDFDAKKYKLNPVGVQQMMHLRCPDGRTLFGVDAFIELWSLFPEVNWLSKLVGFAPLKPFSKIGYWIFARMIRPAMPKRKTSVVCELKSPKPSSRG